MSQPTPGQWPPYPGGGQPGPQSPQWNPSPWQQPAPAPHNPGPWKWIAGAAALVAVIAVTAVIAVSLDRRGASGEKPATKAGTPSDVASANDTGPIGIITEDPACGPFGPINDTLANSVPSNWGQRDPSIPATAWTPDMRAMYETAATQFRRSVDQTLPLIKLTTHRVIRELLEQYVAYTRAFLDHVSAYTPSDNLFITNATGGGSVVSSICVAITNRAAITRGPLVPAIEPPSHIADVGDVNNPSRFLTAPDPFCADFKSAGDQMAADPAYRDWAKGDPEVPASALSPQDVAIMDAVQPVLRRTADTYERLARQSNNPVIEDFGALAAQYWRAYAAGAPTYTPADQYLSRVARRTEGILLTACGAAGLK